MISIFKEMWAPPKAAAALELTRLYKSLEEKLNRRAGAAVVISSSHTSDQVLQMTYDLAWVGTTLLGKRVLVLDTMADTGQAVERKHWLPSSPSAAGAAGASSNISSGDSSDTPPEPSVGTPPGTGAVMRAQPQALADMERALREPSDVGLVSLRVSANPNMAITPQLTEIWSKLQSTFDLILVAAPPVLDDPTASCLGEVVDGAVLLVKAGQSRQRDVTRAIELLTSGATPLLGVVVTDRRHTLPRWLRWMFGER